MKRQFVQFQPSRGQNGFTTPGEQSSGAPAQSREATPPTEPYLPNKKKTGLLSNYPSPTSGPGPQAPTKQQEPPAASWAIREDTPPAASWAIQDDTPPAASWAYVDEQETSITPDRPSERYTDPFMKRDEAEDFLAGRVSPHQSAIARSPFAQPQQYPGGPMQQPGPGAHRDNQ
ncbi:hypothetical protein KSF_026900 [Reticulibacter mediterranei]|uniref:Uncharacterized protein n=1 Tax=Reticulibacter mediterranei TaxID=2778369 RepID=A0A8J3N301_9CHLR|nr:hypothetical protein [Reticulibacter mediterranei]GHO92642.1 hypothetical protein KSF_026900 [Reticulibacter mediterranei]